MPPRVPIVALPMEPQPGAPDHVEPQEEPIQEGQGEAPEIPQAFREQLEYFREQVRELQEHVRLYTNPDDPAAVRIQRENQLMDPEAPWKKDMGFTVFVLTCGFNAIMIVVGFGVYFENTGCRANNMIASTIIVLLWTIMLLKHNKHAVGSTTWATQSSLLYTAFSHALGWYVMRQWYPVSLLGTLAHVVALASIEQGFRVWKRLTFTLLNETGMLVALSIIGWIAGFSNPLYRDGSAVEDALDIYLVVCPFIMLLVRCGLLFSAKCIEDYDRHTQEMRLALSGVNFFQNVWFICALLKGVQGDSWGVCP